MRKTVCGTYLRLGRIWSLAASDFRRESRDWGRGLGKEGFVEETGQGWDLEEMLGLGWGGGHGVRPFQGWGPKQDQ